MGASVRRVLGPHLDGLLLLAVWVVWAATTAWLHGRTLPLLSPYVVSPVVLAGGMVLGRVARRAEPRLVDTMLLALTAALLIGVVMTEGPAKGPLGYANANAAVAVQVVALCGLAMVDAPTGRRLIPPIAGLGAVVVVALNASRAGLLVTVPLVFAIGLALWRPRRRRQWALFTAAAATLLGGALGVVILAVREEWPAWAVRGFDSARQMLWHDAWSLWWQHPIVGGGPGSFQATSPLATDLDTAAAHSLVLQVGAETGGVGVLLLAALIASGLRYSARGAAAYTVIAVAAWTALGLHSFVDHLIEYVPVMLAAGVVLGWASASHSEQLDVGEREPPG